MQPRERSFGMLGALFGPIWESHVLERFVSGVNVGGKYEESFRIAGFYFQVKALGLIVPYQAIWLRDSCSKWSMDELYEPW